MKYHNTKELSSLIKTQNYIDVNVRLPKDDGSYDVIWHVGSMSPKLKEGESLFRKGQFSRYDWDYVVAWKEKK
jgi:hypothetical protein